jgi:hypothetical protein
MLGCVEAVVIGLVTLGVASLLIGTVTSALSRQDSVTLRRWFWAGSDVAAHPERYVRAERVGVVRALGLLGVVLALAGIAISVGYALYRVAGTW